MSYSFTVVGADKAAALVAVAREMEKVVQQQPVHAADRDAAERTAAAFVDLLPTDDTKDVSVSVNGWLQWTGSAQEENYSITSGSCTVTASLKVRVVGESVVKLPGVAA